MAYSPRMTVTTKPLPTLGSGPHRVPGRLFRPDAPSRPPRLRSDGLILNITEGLRVQCHSCSGATNADRPGVISGCGTPDQRARAALY